MIAALSAWTSDRRRVGFALLGSMVVTGLFAIVASRNAELTKAATAPREAPSPVAMPAQAPHPAATLASGPALPSEPPPTVGVRSDSGDVPSPPLPPHRKLAPSASTAHRPLMTEFMDRQTYWARTSQSAGVRSSRPFFSR